MRRGVMLVGAASCLAQTALATPPALTDEALEAVTAIVADGADYTFTGSQSVHMDGEAQRQAQALSLVGAAGSDVGNAVNLLQLDNPAGSDVLQTNQVRQQELHSGSLGRFTLHGENLTRVSSIESHLESGASSSRTSGQWQQSHVSSRTVDQFAVFVPSHDPFQNLELTVATPQLDKLQIPAKSFDFREPSGFLGLEGSFGPFTLGAPQLVLGTVRLEGDDVTLSSGHLVLPSPDLGTLALNACFLDYCVGRTVDLPTFAHDPVPLPDLVFEGANPFKGTNLNAGGGVALVGSGTVSVQPSHVTIAGELTLDLPDPTFSFDFTFGDETDEEGTLIGPFTFDGPDVTIPIPAISVSHTFVDEDIGGSFSGSFDGFLCVPTSMDCGTGSRRTERRESRVDARIHTQSRDAWSSGDTTLSIEVALYAGATLTDAEADLIAMSQASADIATESAIALTDAAQQGMRAANAVNAAGTLVGNALNVSTMRGVSSLGQSNVFVQQRTRRGP
jgi:hypothetical protein